ncbi:MAG: acetyl-CoA C-acyltransferase [Chitinophagales bacterium]
MKEAFIVSAKRTPIGSLMGRLLAFTAPQLGAIAIREALAAAQIEPAIIDSVYFGNVLSANLGQAPARQAAMFAGLLPQTDCTTVNKVCASGLKAVAMATQQIQLGFEQVVVAGGMESMSNTPHYVGLRNGVKLGHQTFTDGILKDGLTDVYGQYHMGVAAEQCAKTYNLTRSMQDEYAFTSYKRAAQAHAEGRFRAELIPVESNGSAMITDEDIGKLIPEKMARLKPSFVEGGTITAANASNLNDGAAALLVVSEDVLRRHALQPLARIVSYADASQEPEWFTTAPVAAIQKALKRASLSIRDIDFFEINEAYSAVALANMQFLKTPIEKVNVYGGAVAVGHPLGASGARILCTLTSILNNENGRYGVAAICNGGGGATAMIIEKLNQYI